MTRIDYYSGNELIDSVTYEGQREIMEELVRIGSRGWLHTPTGKPFSSVECYWGTPNGEFHRQWKLRVD